MCQKIQKILHLVALHLVVIQGGPAQDIVPQDIVSAQFAGTAEVDSEIESHPDHSAITEGVSQIFRRQKGGKPTKGFRCTIRSQEGSYRCQAQHLFRKDGSCQVCQDKEEETAEGRDCRQETCDDQEIRRWIKETERYPDQEGQTERTRVQGQDEGSCSNQVQDSQTKEKVIW